MIHQLPPSLLNILTQLQCLNSNLFAVLNSKGEFVKVTKTKGDNARR